MKAAFLTVIKALVVLRVLFVCVHERPEHVLPRLLSDATLGAFEVSYAPPPERPRRPVAAWRS